MVVWASDNGPSPLPTVTPWLTIGDSGPWRGEIGTVLEGNIRTPCIIRWPGRIPAGRVSNQIVAIVDLFPTLARIAGGKVPTDRPIDGVDQRDDRRNRTARPSCFFLARSSWPSNGGTTRYTWTASTAWTG
jgi:arylsulfatase